MPSPVLLAALAAAFALGGPLLARLEPAANGQTLGVGLASGAAMAQDSAATGDAAAPAETAAPAADAAADDATADTAASADPAAIPDMVLGNADAPVTVIEYASFTCPHCAAFHADQFQQLKADYIDTGKVRFVYREVYFDRFGLWASMIARCGGEQRFFGISDLLYDGQRDWIGEGDPATIAENLRRIGRTAGLDDTTLDACLADNAQAEALVAWFQENAEADAIDSTPTFVIDGTKHSNMSFDEMSAILDEALAG